MPCKIMRLAFSQTMHMSTDIVQLCTLLLALFFINITTASNQDNSVSLLFQKKTDLSQTLDSLNLLKQNKKRENLSFADIEIKEKEILDSLQLIRQKIQTSLSNSIQTSKVDENRFSLFKPLNFSDWLILFTAIAALFFGILLLFVMAKKILFPNNKKSIQSVRRISDAPNLKNITPISISESQNTPIKTADPQVLPLEEDQNTEKNNPVDHTSEAENELETQILKAISEGKNIQEISRLFHLSSDHVSLILRLSKSHLKK